MLFYVSSRFLSQEDSDSDDEESGRGRSRSGSGSGGRKKSVDFGSKEYTDEWKVGDDCEVHSVSQDKWYTGSGELAQAVAVACDF